jgi:hypothetical protein
MVSDGGDIVRHLKTMSLRTERTYETEMPAVQAPESQLQANYVLERVGLRSIDMRTSSGLFGMLRIQLFRSQLTTSCFIGTASSERQFSRSRHVLGWRSFDDDINRCIGTWRLNYGSSVPSLCITKPKRLK